MSSFLAVNYNNLYGRWVTTQYLRQIKENKQTQQRWIQQVVEILAGKDLQTKLRKSENVEQRDSEGKRCQARDRGYTATTSM